MAATTITRESMTNGVTVWNVARVGSAIYDRVDSLVGSAITFGATVSAEGLGVHNFSVGATGVNVLAVRNTSAGTGNAAEVRIGNDVSASALTLTAHSSTAAFGGNFGVIDETGDGLFIRALGASTAGIQFATGAGANVRLTINASGVVSQANATQFTPQASSLLASGTIANLTHQGVVFVAALAGLDAWGLTAGSASGQVVHLVNDGANALNLLHESGSATAADRFALPGDATVVLGVGEGVTLIYSGVLSRWVACLG